MTVKPIRVALVGAMVAIYFILITVAYLIPEKLTAYSQSGAYCFDCTWIAECKYCGEL